MVASFVFFALILIWSVCKLIPKFSGAIGCLSLLLLSPLLLSLAFKIWSHMLVRDRIPEAFMVGYLSDGEAGDPCGLVSYAIDPLVAAEIGKRGLDFFPGTMKGRDLHWSNWSETPLRKRGQNFIFLGATDDRVLFDAVKRKLSRSGSFYSLYGEGILVIDPAEARIAYGYCFS
jgi:hypothetical protein